MLDRVGTSLPPGSRGSDGMNRISRGRNPAKELQPNNTALVNPMLASLHWICVRVAAVVSPILNRILDRAPVQN